MAAAISRSLETGLHTPGPWRVVRHNADKPGLGWLLEAENNTLIGRVHDAVIEHDPYTHEPVRSEATDANARLIAAAPELLKVADMLYDAVDMMMDGPDDSDVAYAEGKLAEAFKLARELRKKIRGD